MSDSQNGVESATETVPAGYQQLPTGLGYTDGLQPSYRRIEGESASFGLLVQAQHSNTKGEQMGGETSQHCAHDGKLRAVERTFGAKRGHGRSRPQG